MTPLELTGIIVRLQGPDAEELAMISVQLASKFLFSVGFHTKKTLR